MPHDGQRADQIFHHVRSENHGQIRPELDRSFQCQFRIGRDGKIVHDLLIATDAPAKGFALGTTEAAFVNGASVVSGMASVDSVALSISTSTVECAALAFGVSLVEGT